MKDKKRIEISDGAAIPTEEDIGLLTAWRIAFVGTIVLIIALCLFKPDPYLEILEFVPDGVIVTFKVTIISIICSFFVGLITGLGRISKNRIINLVASTYVEVIRGIPLLVQLFYIYYAIGTFTQIPPFFAAILALTICYGAYMGEVFRAGIESIDKGQTEAALSLGFNKRQTMLYVILPQAMRTILPPVGNEFIALLKDTSLVSIIAVADLLRRGREYATATFNYFETFTMIALIYLLITLILSKCVSYMEKKLTPYA
ncbi:polar amino acid ABC transporter, inner membrane subunit [Thermodesulfatator indicus DSM 15286]|uniref:Putative glutamine transport system permease protein GlnP n=1 Tax=Thermodesulfatator indicus (strain DSM 15286 / JCM 11887 / CIR29812) TaxID=667014 RepID=F8AAC8_THEID|nr:amino acid ABC transporter permease [Thermodesulfatator indicus]AEH44266.1 polar amino acid ABC transporter, inner membrane subunit [Thermodesulfatator indicus DSM 15286]